MGKERVVFGWLFICFIFIASALVFWPNVRKNFLNLFKSKESNSKILAIATKKDKAKTKQMVQDMQDMKEKKGGFFANLKQLKINMIKSRSLKMLQLKLKTKALCLRMGYCIPKKSVK